MHCCFCGSLDNIESIASNAGSFYNQSNNGVSEVTGDKEQKLSGPAHLTATRSDTKSQVQEKPKPESMVKTSVADRSSVKENLVQAISNYDQSIQLECLFDQRKVQIGSVSRVSQDVAGRNQPESPLESLQQVYHAELKQPSSQNNQGSQGQQSIGLISSKEQPSKPNEPTTKYLD